MEKLQEVKRCLSCKESFLAILEACQIAEKVIWGPKQQGIATRIRKLIAPYVDLRQTKIVPENSEIFSGTKAATTGKTRTRKDCPMPFWLCPNRVGFFFLWKLSILISPPTCKKSLKTLSPFWSIHTTAKPTFSALSPSVHKTGAKFWPHGRKRSRHPQTPFLSFFSWSLGLPVRTIVELM